MGGTPTQSPTVYGAQDYQSLAQNLPSILGAVNNAAVPTAQANLSAAQTVTPAYSKLSLDTLSQYLPQYANVGSNVANQEALAGAQTNVNLLNGSGAQAAQQATALQNSLNPETTAVRQAEAPQVQSLVDSINLNGLSGGEEAAVERANADNALQTGNLGVDNTISSLTNASNFSGALQAKRDALSNALNTATQFLPNSTTGVNGAGIALSNPSANSGTSQFAAAPSAAASLASTSGQAAGIANNALNASTGLFNNIANINANRSTGLDQATQVIGSAPT